MIDKNKIIYKNLFINSLLIFLFLTFIFGRSFMGVTIFNYRIGEYLIGAALLLFLFCLMKKKYIENVFSKEIYFSIILIFTTFLIFLLLDGGSFFNEYTYKSSLYIWVLSFIFLGNYLFNNMKNGIYEERTFKKIYTLRVENEYFCVKFGFQKR